MDALSLHQDAERKYKLMGYLPVGMLSVSYPVRIDEAIILDADEYFTKLTGYSMEDLAHLYDRRYISLVDPRDRFMVAEQLGAALKDGESFEYTYRLMAKDDRIIWIREAGYVSTATLRSRTCILSDVSELHRYSEQLTQNEQMFRIASNVSGGAVYDYEFSTGSYLLFENAERIYGVPASRIIEETQWFGTLTPEKAVCAMADYFYHPEDVPMVLEAFERLQKDRSIHYVARSKRPDGRFLWTQVHIALIFDQNGQPVRRVGYILDIDEMKRHSDKMAQSEQLFRIINNASGGAMFDFDFATGGYLHFENAEHIYGVPASKIISDTKWFGTLTPPKALDAMISYFYHPEDANLVRESFGRLERESTVTYIARSKRYDGTFIWSQVHIALIFDESGIPVRRVGHILDIDSMARQMERLKSQAQTDPLTGVYNKLAAQNIVEKILRKRSGTLCALMVLDVDNFKDVNDTFGHPVGDAVLVDVARKLKEAFGDETLGRIGGDEFIIFTMGLKDRSVVLEKADQVCRLFRQTCIVQDTDYKISCSIGIAISYDESQFADLFEKADLALYQAKDKGRDCYCLYEE